MHNNEFDSRKNIRREHRKSKNLDKYSNNKYEDQKDQYKIKKQFKNYKQKLFEEELWKEWENEIY